MVLQLVGSIILVNSKNEYLMIENIKSNKFEFPKCDKHIDDTNTYEAIIRGLYYQTGFMLGRDYIMDPSINLASLFQLKNYNRFTYFFVGRTLRDDLYFDRDPYYYNNKIVFIPYKDLMKVKVYYDTNNARVKLKRLLTGHY